ncbi:ABC transporter permease [Chitinophaga sp. CF418]|uniref:ABC transporter permease n=1 Tax=Chitinophaga sp. CF418 TaxID=1855287 RepID=UPI00091B5C74|nr:ABC transporter permease [Chitinophaga sp. CF418]SHN38687.1 FtsX-like permease family protein [Chitinophaga sp. CF418]
MFKSYFKIAFRNLVRQKLFTGLNIFGLATGMTCSLLIFLWVQDELSFDKFNKNAGNIYRLTARIGDNEAATVPPAMAAAMKAEIPGVKNATRIAPFHRMVTVGTTKFDEKDIYFADTNFLKIFSYPLLSGNVNTALAAPDAVVLTEATAIRYFGTADGAIGKTIYIDNDIKGTNLTVTGILKNVPANSHLQFDLLLPMQLYDKINSPDGAWTNFDVYTYLELSDHAALSKIARQAYEIRARNDKFPLPVSFFAQPLTDIHLYSHYMLDVPGQGNKDYVMISSLVAIFILLIACINFMNLSTALSSQRAKEVGLRKTIGAERFQLILQFMGESLLITAVSLVIAIALAALLLPLFNDLTSKSISLNLLSIRIVSSLLATAVLVGVVSGSYPAFFLSSFKPVKVLKGVAGLHGRKSFLRNGLVIVQFAISVILMVCTLVVYRQLQFIKNKNIGFDKENLLYVKMPEVGDLHANKEALTTTLDQYSGIRSYTIADNLPTYISNGMELRGPAMKSTDYLMGYRLRTDANFIKTFNMQLVAGRFFSKDMKGDDTTYVVNETAIKAMHLTPSEAIGLTITFNDAVGTIIGVVKDFNFKPIQQPVEPLVMKNNFAGGYVVMRTTPGNMQAIIGSIKKVFEKVYGDYPFSYGFVDEDLQKLYLAEQRMGKLFNIFSVLSIIISSLGLFGLATFATQKRFKEIGIRKVMGASEAGIVAMLTKDFIRLVAFALVIAFPVAWWAMNKWLDNFFYRIDIGWWMFALAGCVALAIAFLTVSYQSIKAAVADPIKSLRTE